MVPGEDVSSNLSTDELGEGRFFDSSERANFIATRLS
jgi:hypothetical protein